MEHRLGCCGGFTLVFFYEYIICIDFHRFINASLFIYTQCMLYVCFMYALCMEYLFSIYAINTLYTRCKYKVCVIFLDYKPSTSLRRTFFIRTVSLSELADIRHNSVSLSEVEAYSLFFLEYEPSTSLRRTKYTTLFRLGGPTP